MSESDLRSLVRLHKLLASSGVASRRACEQLMLEGRVEVDGQVVTRLGARVDPRSAVVRVDGRRIAPRTDRIYLALNKPRGVVSTMSDPQGRPTVADYVTKYADDDASDDPGDHPGDHTRRLFHVGRLDTDTDGLLLLTDDGELAHRLAHPSYEVTKTYVAQVRGVPAPRLRRRLTEGIVLEDGPVRVEDFRVLASQSGRAVVELVIHEGRNRIVRRLLAEVGHPVQRLTRTAVGPVRLGELAPGSVRSLTDAERAALLDAVGM